MTSSRGLKIRISGVSIAGPTLGYWLAEYGFDVEIVERSSEVRGSSSPVAPVPSAKAVAAALKKYKTAQSTMRAARREMEAPRPGR